MNKYLTGVHIKVIRFIALGTQISKLSIQMKVNSPIPVLGKIFIYIRSNKEIMHICRPDIIQGRFALFHCCLAALISRENHK